MDKEVRNVVRLCVEMFVGEVRSFVDCDVDVNRGYDKRTGIWIHMTRIDGSTKSVILESSDLVID